MQKESKIKLLFQKTISSSLQGYLFGCVVGSFTNKSSANFKTLFKDINSTGITFAKVGAIYGFTEGCLDLQSKKPINSIYASALSGALVQIPKGKKAAFAASAVFAGYNAMFQMYGGA